MQFLLHEVPTVELAEAPKTAIVWVYAGTSDISMFRTARATGTVVRNC